LVFLCCRLHCFLSRIITPGSETHKLFLHFPVPRGPNLKNCLVLERCFLSGYSSGFVAFLIQPSVRSAFLLFFRYLLPYYPADFSADPNLFLWRPVLGRKQPCLLNRW